MDTEKQYGKNGRRQFGKNFQRKDDKPQIAALLDRQPPYSQDSEVGVLGSMMLMPTNIDDVAVDLRAEDFYFEANKVLFQTLVDMRNEGKTIDPTLIVERLKDKGQFELIGGASYIADVFTKVPNAANARFYASIVREKSLIRSVIESTTDILRDAYELSLIHI